MSDSNRAVSRIIGCQDISQLSLRLVQVFFDTRYFILNMPDCIGYSFRVYVRGRHGGATNSGIAVRSNREYSRQVVFEAEHGICQKCGVDAHKIYLSIKQTHDMESRAGLIQDSHYSKLKATVKQRMCGQPTPGLFWHVDHIMPVADGGGECDLDNLRTLCTVCHMAITAQWNKQRAPASLLAAAASTADITTYFSKH